MQLGAMVIAAAAWRGEISGPGSDNNRFPIPAGQQDSLQICHGSGESHLVDDDNLSHDMVDVVFLLRDGRELAFGIGAAKAGIVQAINYHWCVLRQALTEPDHLRQNCRHCVGRENPPAGGDGLGDDAESGGGVGVARRKINAYFDYVFYCFFSS